LNDELNQNSKIYKRLMDEKDFIYKQNLKLVKLPKKIDEFPYKEDNIMLDDFVGVCEDYGFYSFLKKDKLKEWKEIFGMR
jgi:hypothetical protein